MQKIAALLLCCLPAIAANITVTPSTTYQTWHYWMSLVAPTPAFTSAEPAADPNWNTSIKPVLLGQLVNQLGINTAQLTVASGDIENNKSPDGVNDCWTYFNVVSVSQAGWRSCVYAPVNDDGDPAHFNCPDPLVKSCPANFPMAGMDFALDNYIVGQGGLKALVNANGETFHLVFQWVHWPSAPTFLDTQPAEAGEHILAAFTHIRSKYGPQYVPDILDIMVEPDLHCIAANVPSGDCGQAGQWDFKKLGSAMYAIQTRLSSAGFHPQFWCCSTTSSVHAKDWYNNVRAQGPTQIGAFTTHWYDAPKNSAFVDNAAQAAADNVPVVMTELTTLGIDTVYTLITAGNVSGIEKYGAASLGASDSPSNLLTITSADPYASRYVASASGPTYTYFFPQLWHYIRENDVREQASSNDPHFLPLAFRSPGGLDKIAILVQSAGNQSVTVTGVNAGTYGCTYTYSNAVLLHSCGPDQTIAVGGTLNADLPSIPANPPSSLTAAVVTFYQLAPAAPSIDVNGVVPIDSKTPVIQPGSWISIYGSNFAGGLTVWNEDFPTSLGNVSVTVNGKSGYLWFVSPGQINLQAPDDTISGPVDVIVNTPNGKATATVTLAPRAPALSLLASPQPNSLYPAAQIYTTLGYDGLLGPPNLFTFASRAVRPGETLALYGVGFGPTVSPVPAGRPFGGAADTANPVTVSIGGISVPASFAGLIAPGLYQINVVVPNAGSGDQPIFATVNGIQTQPGVYVTLQ